MSDDKKKKQLTTSVGNPVSDNQNAKTAGARGPFHKADPASMPKGGVAEAVGVENKAHLVPGYVLICDRSMDRWTDRSIYPV